MKLNYFKNNRLELILLVVIVATASYLRIYGLSTWGLAIDEYYFTKSILSIAENGLPNFPNGGYYVRGLLVQYLIAPFTLFIDKIELAVRIVPVFFNLLTIPAVYLVAKRVAGREAALLSVFLFCFSLWEIEFARYSRMYTTFQFLFIWQVYFLIEYFRTNSLQALNYILLIAFLATFVHAASIFMISLTFFILIAKKPQHNHATYWLVSLLILGLCLAYYMIDFRQASPPPPEFQEFSDPTSGDLINLPNFLLLKSGIDFYTLILFIISIIISVVVSRRYKFFSSVRFDFIQLSTLIVFIIGLAANQMLLATLTLLILLIYPFQFDDSELLKNQKANQFKSGLLILVVWMFAWTSIYLINNSFDHLEYIDFFFGFPNMVHGFFRVWIKAMPYHSLLIFSVLAVRYMYLVLSDTSQQSKVEKQIYTILLLLITLTFVVNTKHQSTTYTFFLYPLFLILFSSSIIKFSSLLNSKKIAGLTASIGLLAFIALSEPYDLDHLRNIDSAKYNFRIPYDYNRAVLYYPKLDFKSAAEFVNDNIQQKDSIITLSAVVDLYLDKKPDFKFMRTRFMDGVLSCGGKCYIWNGLEVLYKPNDLYKQIENAKKNLWLIAPFEDRYFGQGKMQKHLIEKYSANIVYTNYDKSIAVYKF